ncbi:hypothetical protein D9M72_563270 [compost metagenome]
MERDSPDDAPAIIVYSATSNGLITGTYITDLVEEEADAAFIAAAPSTVARLLGALERVEGVLAQWDAEAAGNRNTAAELRKEPRTNMNRTEIARHEQAAVIAQNHAVRIRAAITGEGGE